MKYRTGQNPLIGDVVALSPKAPRVKFRRAGSRAIVTDLGVNFIDPMPGIVLVLWNEDFTPPKYPDYDIRAIDLELVRRAT